MMETGGARWYHRLARRISQVSCSTWRMLVAQGVLLVWIFPFRTDRSASLGAGAHDDARDPRSDRARTGGPLRFRQHSSPGNAPVSVLTDGREVQGEPVLGQARPVARTRA
jgi:hypothetical protein